MGRKRKNHVYAYFNYQKETNTSKCDIEDCNKVIKGNHGTNLLHHLSSKHVEEYNMIMKYNNLANEVEVKENCGEGTSSAGIKNIRTEVTQEEFAIPERSRDRSQQREEELHKLKVAEREWMVKAAQENYYKAKAEKEWTVKAAEENYYKVKAERETAEELLLFHRAKSMEAEMSLNRN